MDSLLSQLKRLHLSLQPSKLQLVAKEGRKVVAGKETEAEEKEEEARVAVVALEDTTSRRIRTQDQRVFLLS